MKHTFLLYSLCAFFLSTTPVVQSSSESHNAPGSLHEAFLTQSEHQHSMLCVCLEQIAGKVSSHAFTPASETAHVLAWAQNFADDIKLLTQSVKHTLQDTPLHIRTTIACELTSLYSNLIKKALTSNCLILELPEEKYLSLIFEAAYKQPITLEELATKLALQENMLQDLLKTISDMGKTWYNKAYNTIISNNWHKTAYNATIFGGTAALITTYLLGKYFLQKKESFLNEFTNNYEIRSVVDGGTTYLGQTIASFVETTDSFFSHQYKNSLMTSGILFGLANINQAWASIKNIDSTIGLSSTITNNMSTIHDFLRGAQKEEFSFKNQAVVQHIDDITLDSPYFTDLPHIEPLKNLIKYMENPELYSSLGLKVDKTLMLIGNSGNGKTFAIRGVCGSINKLLSEQGSFNKIGYIEVTPNMSFLGGDSVDAIIEQAKAHAPCIIFWDEFHLASLQVDRAADLLKRLIIAIDDVNKKNDPHNFIVLCAATNRPDTIDSALINRFTLIMCDNPTFAQRKNMLTHFCLEKGITPESLNLDLIAHMTELQSARTLTKLFKHAVFLAHSTGSALQDNHLYQALNTVVRSIIPTSLLTDQERYQLAAYYSGIVHAHRFIQPDYHIESVTICGTMPKITEQYDWQVRQEKRDIKEQLTVHYGNMFIWHDNEYIQSHTYDALKKQAKMVLAGVISQEILLNDITDISAQARHKAFEILQKTMLKGFTFESLSEKRKNDIKDAVVSLIETYEQEIRTLLTPCKESLHALAQELTHKELVQTNDYWNRHN